MGIDFLSVFERFLKQSSRYGESGKCWRNFSWFGESRFEIWRHRFESKNSVWTYFFVHEKNIKKLTSISRTFQATKQVFVFFSGSPDRLERTLNWEGNWDLKKIEKIGRPRARVRSRLKLMFSIDKKEKFFHLNANKFFRTVRSRKVHETFFVWWRRHPKSFKTYLGLSLKGLFFINIWTVFWHRVKSSNFVWLLWSLYSPRSPLSFHLPLSS